MPMNGIGVCVCVCVQWTGVSVVWLCGPFCGPLTACFKDTQGPWISKCFQLEIHRSEPSAHRLY